MEKLDKISRKDLIKILAIIILSDGTISKDKKYLKSITLETVPYNKCQHDFFTYLCLKLFDKRPKRYLYRRNNRKMLTSKLFGKKYIEELLKLSPSYQTTKGPNKSKKDFLKSRQPSIKFILTEKRNKIKKLALRTYFDFDGSIIPSFKIKNKKQIIGGKTYNYYQVQFECDINIAETNPNLVKELTLLCKMLNLKAITVKDKRQWSGINGIRISKLDNIKKFIKYGGPITNVKISSKSRRLKGKTKKAVCKAVINLLNKKIPLSYHFKNYGVALEKKEKLNKLLLSKIRNITNN